MSDWLIAPQNLHLIDQMYKLYQADPQAVDRSWRAVFTNGHAQVAPARVLEAPLSSGADAAHVAEVTNLVLAYRVRGHLEANLDPLGQAKRGAHPDLDPRSYGFSEAQLDTIVVDRALDGVGPLTLRQLIARLRSTYCHNLGVEFMHISRPERRRWLKERMEPTSNRTVFDRSSQLNILDRLIAGTELERFIQAKYVGTKRFSLEGGETLVPLIDGILECAGGQGVEDVVIGMAHRGRLNLLVNIMRMSPRTLFAEFEDFDAESAMGAGDVKYHLGFSSDHVTRAGDKMHLSLMFNPSHLEAVDPVVLGRVRAKQRRLGDTLKQRVMGILIHGDAAFAGQGLVAECLQLSDLRGYRTGGTVHVIVNNQIGFTTGPTDSRSTPYPTDVAKMIEVPIFHVNGDDPEAVMHVVGVAMDYRRTFQTDVVIDMFCFRRFGHNEVDEPSFTQPLLYEKIKHHPAVYELYAKRLIEGGVATQESIQERVDQYNATLTEDLEHTRRAKKRPPSQMMGAYWKGFVGGKDPNETPETAVARDKLEAIAGRLSTLPPGFEAHPKIVRLMQQRAAMGRGEQPLDWAMAEAMAFGSLLWDGTVVRMSGQDSRRGTFSQRHAVIVDVKTGSEYVPLMNLRPGQGALGIYDSSLSEAGVLGFEFGYSLVFPDGLVLWEAQFGDFANGAQVILDQFISASEDRWQLLSGIVLLLPHGYEGQGPEHSSARFERFLQLAAEDNIQVCYPTTPAQFFHLLRRQVLRKWRKPLIVMAPKATLRLAAASSPLEDLTTGTFERILDDPTADPRRIDRVMICTGKVYYDLVEERKRRGDERTAIVRIEQLYPLLEEDLAAKLERYTGAKEWIWVQEEPGNMGARTFLEPRLRRIMGKRSYRAAARAESASPATGSYKAHLIELRMLFDDAFGGPA
jgi:2-oxoglutarate dehydrogenase E1 component